MGLIRVTVVRIGELGGTGYNSPAIVINEGILPREAVLGSI
jgi:hypothetical protein